MGAAIPSRSLRQAPARFALACCASLFLHLWLAWELPAGAPRAHGAAGILTVQLQPAASEKPGAPPALGGVIPDAARVAHVARAPDDRPREPQPMPASPGPRHPGAAAESAGVAAHADPTYYPARQLDVYPALLAPLSIRYPERASAENRAGRALVMLLIDAAGKVDDVTVVEADPPGYFEDAARKTFENAAFSAARRNGVPVRSRVLIQIGFDPRAAAAQAQ